MSPRRDDSRLSPAAWTAWAAAREEARLRERRRRSLLASGVVAAVAIAVGPYETEAEFTKPVAQRVVRQLRAWGADARLVPGRVTPLGAPGAVFLSIHHDSEGGQAAVAWATAPKAPVKKRPGRRAPTQVDTTVEVESKHLALAIHERYERVFRRDNGARSELGPPVGPEARRDLREYYGFFRTNADARVIVEAGAAGDDDRFLEKTGLVAGTLAAGVRDHLVDEGLLERAGTP